LYLHRFVMKEELSVEFLFFAVVLHELS
jgi:hypothetical protein